MTVIYPHQLVFEQNKKVTMKNSISNTRKTPNKNDTILLYFNLEYTILKIPSRSASPRVMRSSFGNLSNFYFSGSVLLALWGVF